MAETDNACCVFVCTLPFVLVKGNVCVNFDRLMQVLCQVFTRGEMCYFDRSISGKGVDTDCFLIDLDMHEIG